MRGYTSSNNIIAVGKITPNVDMRGHSYKIYLKRQRIRVNTSITLAFVRQTGRGDSHSVDYKTQPGCARGNNTYYGLTHYAAGSY